MVKINKPLVRVLRTVEEVMTLIAEQVPALVEHAYLDRDWVWICKVNLSGGANLPARTALKSIGFRFSPEGHLMPDGATRGHWGHCCTKPMFPKRRGSVGGKRPPGIDEDEDLLKQLESLGL